MLEVLHLLLICLDPAIEKIFLNKDKTLILLIPFFIIIAFAAKAASLYGAKVIMIRISEEIKKSFTNGYDEVFDKS